MEVLAIIPARSGSKTINHKNIQSLSGRPLMAYSIEHAVTCNAINRVIVSTDSPYYAEVARSFGAETPFLRPAAISDDHSTDLEVFEHALKWLSDNENYRPDIIVHLRPTSPYRKVEDIATMIDILVANPDFDSVRSVKEHKEPAFKMWFLQGRELQPVVDAPGRELYNQPRQKLPKTYVQNACIDVTRYETIMSKKSMTGDRIGAFIMDYFGDIDDWKDFEDAKRFDASEIKGKTLCVDIDGIIASLTPNNDYSVALPLEENITIINNLYDRGNRIVLFTARGSLTGIDWSSVTKSQLSLWGVKYHELRFGKPGADYYIDDRLIDIKTLKFTETTI